jgi:ParB-like chromosome segregation protein Spo0J
MKAHAAAMLFPMMSDNELNELAADIADHGQHHAIITWNELIVDGRNRWRACEIAGVEPETRERSFADDGEVARYVLSENVHRRHLSIADKMRLVPQVLGMYEAAAASRMKAGKKDPSANLQQGHRAADDVARDLGVSPRTVQNRIAVEKRGVPELGGMVDRGEVSVSAAAEVAKMDKAKQRAAVKGGAEAVKGAAKKRRRVSAHIVEPTMPRRPFDGMPTGAQVDAAVLLPLLEDLTERYVSPQYYLDAVVAIKGWPIWS